MRILIKICATAFLTLAIIQAVLWAVAGVSYREFELAFQDLRKGTPTAEEFTKKAQQTQKYIQWAVGLAPGNPEYLLGQGRFTELMTKLVFRPELLPEPATSFANAARSAPTWVWPYLELARLCAQRKNKKDSSVYTSCDTLFATAVSLAPTMAYGHENWADFTYDQVFKLNQPPPDMLARMCSEYGDALRLNRGWRGKPSYYRSLWQKAFTRTATLNRQYALLRKLNPDSPQEWANVALILGQAPEGLWDTSKIGLMNDMYKVDAEDPWPNFFYTSGILANNGLPKNGLDVIEFYLQKQPHDPRGWQLYFKIADAYPGVITRSQRKKMIARALRESDFERDAWLEFARTAFLIGDKKGYMKTMQDVFARTGPSSWGYAYLGDLLENSGDLELAEKAFRESVRLDPSEVKFLARLGMNLSAQGKFMSAVNILEKALALDPANKSILQNLKAMGVY